MTTRCTFRLATDRFEIELEGDARFIEDAYLGLRASILERLQPGSFGLGPPPKLEAPPLPDKNPPYLWVLRCNDFYNKVHVLERSVLAEHTLGRHVDAWRLTRICIEGEIGPPFEALLPPGNTLWSELTPVGRDRLRKV